MTRSAAIIALLLLSTSSFAQARTPAAPRQNGNINVTSATTGEKIILPPGVLVGPSVEGITEYRYPNGLTVLLFPDAGEPTTLVNITYASGSAQENNGESGMAHLLEHLLFRGTPTTPLIGEAFKHRNIDANGSTAYDRTNYYGFFEPNEKTLTWLLSLEADRMRNANITQADLDAEMTVVRNEMEIGQNKPSRRLMGLLSSLAYEWHPYGKSVIGNRSEVEHVPVERLRAFYDRWYQPDNATVIIAGSFDPSRTLAEIDLTLGKVPRPARTLPGRYTREPAQDGERSVTIRRAGPDNIIGIVYHTPGVTGADFAALKVLDSVMGSAPSGRFFQSLVKTGIASNAETGLEESGAPSLIGFYAGVGKTADPAKLEAAMLDQIEKIADHPITDTEVAAAKQRIANTYARANSGNPIGVANGLSDEIGAGDWRLWFYGRDRVAQVTTAEVNRVAQKYLINTNRTLARFVPTNTAPRVEIAEAPAAADLLKDYKGGKGTPSVEMFDYSVANIAARTQHRSLGPNLKLALLPKSARGERFEASMQFRFGDEATAGRYRDAGNMVGDLLMRGTTTMSAEQVAEKLDNLNARLNFIAGPRSVLVKLRGQRKNFVPTMKLVADILRNPALSEKEFEFVRKQQIDVIEKSGQEPGQIADNAMRQHFDGYPHDNPEAFITKEERLAGARKLTLDEVRAFHRDFYGTSIGEIAIVGDFDQGGAVRELKSLFAGWLTKRPFVPYADPFFAPVQSVRRVFETPEKPNAVITSQSKLRMGPDSPDHAAVLIAARVFGGSSKASRLGMRIREREGLSYYVGSGIIINPENENGVFYMQATAAPENMPRVEKAMKEELERFIAEGITPSEFADAKSVVLNSLRQSRSYDGGIAGDLRFAMYIKRDMLWPDRFEKAVQATTLEQVNAAIRAYINPADISYFIAGDFARVASAAKPTADGM